MWHPDGFGLGGGNWEYTTQRECFSGNPTIDEAFCTDGTKELSNGNREKAQDYLNNAQNRGNDCPELSNKLFPTTTQTTTTKATTPTVEETTAAGNTTSSTSEATTGATTSTVEKITAAGNTTSAQSEPTSAPYHNEKSTTDSNQQEAQFSLSKILKFIVGPAVGGITFVFLVLGGCCKIYKYVNDLSP